MKHTNTFFALVALFAISFFSASMAETFSVLPSKTDIKWKATQITGENFGNLTIKSGHLEFDDNAIKSGEFIIDMNSMTVNSLEPGDLHDKLLGHLKSDDFFAADKYPTSKFVITSAKKSGGKTVVTGDLTIRGITHPNTFTATSNSGGNTLTLVSKITVDRSKYNVKFRSGNFFENLGDKLIHDNFTIDIKLVASKG